jgi:hypothetical protein
MNDKTLFTLAVVAEPQHTCICKIGLDWSTLKGPLYLAEVGRHLIILNWARKFWSFIRKKKELQFLEKKMNQNNRPGGDPTDPLSFKRSVFFPMVAKIEFLEISLNRLYILTRLLFSFDVETYIINCLPFE